MKKLLEIFFIVLVLLLANTFIYLFWWTMTDPGNYIWEPISEQKEEIIQNACTKIFWIKYYTWAAVINLLTFGFLVYYLDKRISVSLGLLAVGVHTCSWYFFDPYIGQNYVIIFENEQVSRAFLTEPIKRAGEAAGSLLLLHLSDPTYSRREYAIKALGEIKYRPASEQLGKILLNAQEKQNIRGASYIALKSIGDVMSKKYLMLFSQLVLQREKDRLLIQKLEKDNSY